MGTLAIGKPGAANAALLAGADRRPGATRGPRAAARLARGTDEGSAGEHRPVSIILPGATIGILGGGQLGRMTAMAARSLGLSPRSAGPGPVMRGALPGGDVRHRRLRRRGGGPGARAALSRGHGGDREDLHRGAGGGAGASSRCGRAPGVLHIVQDRARQKDWLAERGFPVGPYRKAATEDELRERGAGARRAVLREGHPGRVRRAGAGEILSGPDDAARVWSFLGGVPVVVEKAPRSRVRAARAGGPSAIRRGAHLPAGAQPPREAASSRGACCPVRCRTRWRSSRSRSPATSPPRSGWRGCWWSSSSLPGTGELLVNELAPRPHNTFHSTEVACATSQFEQHVRAVCDLPLGSTELIRPAAIINLLGDLWVGDAMPPFDRVLEIPGVRVHLYGKRRGPPRAEDGASVGDRRDTGRGAEEGAGGSRPAEPGLSREILAAHRRA